MASGLGTYGMANASPGPSYVPSYEWWPPLIGPGTGQNLPAEHAQYQAGQIVSPYTGLPNSLFGFDTGQLPPDFMLQQPGSNLQQPNVPQYPPRGDPRNPR